MAKTKNLAIPGGGGGSGPPVPHLDPPIRKLVIIQFFGFATEKFQSRENFNMFHIFDQNIDCGYTLEPPRRGGSNRYTQSIFWNRNKIKSTLVYHCTPQYY